MKTQMHPIRAVLTLAFMAFLTTTLACASSPPNGPKVGEPAPAFSLVDTQGTTHTLADHAGKIVVLEWLNFGCPFVRKHYDTGNMQALQERFTADGVVWLSVVTTPEGKMPSGENVQAEFEKHSGASTAVLLDEGGETGRAYGARTTPHMFVIDPEGMLIYMGAIDDRPTSDKKDVEGAKNYVAMAIEATKAGSAASPSATQPYGCSIKY